MRQKVLWFFVALLAALSVGSLAGAAGQFGVASCTHGVPLWSARATQPTGHVTAAVDGRQAATSYQS